MGPQRRQQGGDALADGRTEGFQPENRVHANVWDIQWLVLGKLMKAGEAFYREATRIKERRKRRAHSARKAAGGKRVKLKEREPW